LLSKDFLTGNNLSQIALQSSINAVVAVGMTLVIITAGIDLAVGSVAGLTSVIAATLMVTNGIAWELAIPLAVALGIAAGMANGGLIAHLGLAPFVVTLGALSIYRGLALVTTNGETVFNFPTTFRNIFGGDIGPIPTPVIIALLVAGTAMAILRGTSLGEHIVAVGGNEEAARLSGVRVAWTRIVTFGLSGLFAAMAGLIEVSRTVTARADAGGTLALEALAAVVIGGSSIMGGQGAIWRTVLGVFLLGLISNGFNILGINPFYRSITEGVIILVAVAGDVLARRGRPSR
jgi:ribose transport system permease protein